MGQYKIDDGIAGQTMMVVVTEQARNVSESVNTPVFIVIFDTYYIFITVYIR